MALRQGAPGVVRANAPSFLMVRRRRDDGDETVRVGLTVTKKIGGAVVRNRIRRRLREGAKAIFPAHAEPGCDYVMIARPQAYERAWPDLLDDMKGALLRLSRIPT